MTGISTKTFLIAAALGGAVDFRVRASRRADALGAEVRTWAMPTARTARPSAYKMGTNNAGTLLKGAKKVPKGTLFFIGENGQLYMRTGPYLEDDGKFMFGAN